MASEQPISTYRASSCTLCDETEHKRAQQAQAMAAKTAVPAAHNETFDGPVIAGATERWATGRILGEGAFATVRLARGLKTGRIAALKTTNLSSANQRPLLFSLREALALAHIPSHPNIPPLLDFARSKTATHTLLSLAPGEELFGYVNGKAEGRLDEEEARRIVAGILEGLRHSHANNVLHRDIKLDNVFYDPVTQTVSLIDFGLATFFDETTSFDEAVGCVNYASPGLLRLTNWYRPYGAANGHSDLWALGVLTHGLLSGFFPFRSEDPIELEQEILSGVQLQVDGLSELGHAFLNMVLDPANEGRISAEQLLRHPWVAPFAAPSSLTTATRSWPKLPSASTDVRRAVKHAEVAVVRLLPPYFASLSRRLSEDVDMLDSASSSSSEETVKVTRANSGTSIDSTSSEATIAVDLSSPSLQQQQNQVPQKRKQSQKSELAKKLLNPSKWFDGLKVKPNW